VVDSARIAIVGGGPSGLMAAEAAVAAGCRVTLYDAMPSVGRKFLLAGKGGLNLTHGEALERFGARYGERSAAVSGWLRDFDPLALRRWARELGVETFIGSSGRVFPTDLKAAPLLRAWLRRLRASGVVFAVRHRWTGWSADGALRFDTPEGQITTQADAVVLAMGGASWPQLGSDGAWVVPLGERGIALAPLQASNCGFDINWSAHFAQRHAGTPLKRVEAMVRDASGREQRQLGECMISTHGIEGQLVYALSPLLRDAITRDGAATLTLDLLPQRDPDWLRAALSRPRGARSLSESWRRAAGIDALRAGLIYECIGREAALDPARTAAALKALPLRLLRPRPIAEAISSAGGVRFEALDDHLMLRALPGVFCCGEMLDWEAPTGGYLLTACFAAGRLAGAAAAHWARNHGMASTAATDESRSTRDAPAAHAQASAPSSADHRA
jgi:uncharacterized flavoprotein (TIGR03862 family)